MNILTNPGVQGLIFGLIICVFFIYSINRAVKRNIKETRQKTRKELYEELIKEGFCKETITLKTKCEECGKTIKYEKYAYIDHHIGMSPYDDSVGLCWKPSLCEECYNLKTYGRKKL